MTASADAGVPGTPDALDRAALSEGRVRSAMSVAVATGIGNALVYVLYAALARLLGPDGYGAFGALAALGFAAAVPAIATQAIVAKHVALRPDTATVVDRDVLRLLRWVNRVGLTTAAVAAAAAPALTAFLHLPGVGAPLWLAAWLWPFTILSGYLGVLQGAGRLRLFGVLLLMAGALRLVGGLAGVVVANRFGAGVAGGWAGITAGAVVTVAVGAAMVGLRSPWLSGAGDRAASRTGELLAASSGLLAVVVLSNVDVVMARHYLPAYVAGLYAAGAIVAKCAFWLPQFVGYVAYRDLARVQNRVAALRLALATVCGIGMIAVVGTALLSGPVMKVTGGQAYRGIAGYAWAFAALGAVLACSQLLVYAGIASGQTRLNRLVWMTALVEATLLVTALHRSIWQVVGGAVAVNCALAVVGTVATVRGSGTRTRMR